MKQPAVILLVIGLMFVLAQPARGVPNGNASADPANGMVTTRLHGEERLRGSDSRDSAGRPGQDVAATLPRAQKVRVWRESPDAQTCGGANSDPNIVDVRFDLVEVDYSTDPPNETVLQSTCLAPSAAPVVAPPPPVPPTMEEIYAVGQSQIIRPIVNLSPKPEFHGITGLETYLWYSGQPEVLATASVRGYTITATMRPTRFYWDMGDDSPFVESSVAGSEAEPAARYTYETKGLYTVALQTVWDGSWTYTGNGLSDAGAMPSIRVVGTTDYKVDEIRSQLVLPDLG